MFFVIPVSGVCLLCIRIFSNWCAGSVGIFWRAGSCIFFVCVSPLCGVPGRYKLTWAFCWSGWRHCTDFPSSWRCSSGYGRVEMMKGVVRFSYFLQFAVSFLGGWMSTVGIFVLYILLFFGRFVVLSRDF